MDYLTVSREGVDLRILHLGTRLPRESAIANGN
jgi:hypothetical protein